MGIPVDELDDQTSRDARVRQVSANLRRLVTAAKGHFHAQEKSTLSGAQIWALWQVKNSPGLTVMELANKLSIHQSTTSNLIEKLETSGNLRRKRTPEDRRVVKLFATAAGIRLMEQLPEPQHGIVPNAIDRLSDSELGIVEKALALLSREISTLKGTTDKR